MKEQHISAKGLTIWLICALFFLYEFLLRTIIGAFQFSLMKDLSITAIQFSVLSTTVFMSVYGLMQIPAAVITRNFGLKTALFIGSFACGITCLGFSIASNYKFALILRTFMGFGAAFGFIGILIAVHEWMPKKKVGLYIGLSQFIGTTGPMLAGGPLETLIEMPHITWRVIFFWLGIIGTLLSFLILYFVESNQEKSGQYFLIYRPEKTLISLKRLFVRKAPWAIALYAASIYFTVEYFSENEGRAFLITKGFLPTTASYMLTLSWIGYAIGCPLLGYISDYLERRKIILVTTAYIGFMTFAVILFATNKPLIQLAFFLLGFSAAGQSIAFAMTSEQFKKGDVPLGFGLNNAIITLLCATNAPIMGFFLESIKEGPTPTVTDYQLTFIPIVVLNILAVLLSSIWIKESFCKSQLGFTTIAPNKKEQQT